MMTQIEKKAKRILIKKLSEEGYRTYANILGLFDIHLTSDPSVVGYMNPGKGSITVNRGLDMDQISVIIRHEILHEYLDHIKRLLKKVNAPSLDLYQYKNKKENPDDLTIEDLINLGYDPYLANVAGDLEISNLGYTEEDKNTVRNLKLNGKIVSGLVTEDQHPDWVDLSVEDMYDELIKERKQEDPTQQDVKNNQEKQQNNDQSQPSGQQPNNGQEQQNQQSQSGQSSNQSQQQQSDNQKQGNQQSGSSNQQSNSENSNDDQSNDSSDGEQITYIRGRFIDDTTFEDEDGNIIRL